VKKILSIILLVSALLTAPCSCTKNADQDIYCDVTLQAVLPDGGDIITLEVDMSVKGNFFRNLNTQQDYDYPIFANNKCTLRVLKGVYILAFDGKALLSDGSYRTVRCSQYTAPADAVTLLEDSQTLELDLTILK